MLSLGNPSRFALLSRLTIRTKTLTACAVALTCLIGMGATVRLTSN